MVTICGEVRCNTKGANHFTKDVELISQVK